MLGVIITLFVWFFIEYYGEGYTVQPLYVPPRPPIEYGPGTHDPTKYTDPSAAWVDCEGDCID